MQFQITAEPTPNPQSFKFNFDRNISVESAEFLTAEDTGRSPLATKLFGFPWVDAVFIGTNFVTVTKQDWVDWDVLVEPLKGLIGDHMDQGYVALLPPRTPAQELSEAGEVSEAVSLIKKVIDEEIRPAVAMDGGDIVFDRFENGVVYIHMRGACSGCPSSTQTLKMGIETRLMEAVSSIREVVAL